METTDVVRLVTYIVGISLAIVLCTLVSMLLADANPFSRMIKRAFWTVVLFPYRWYRNYRDEAHASREWEREYSERRKAAEHLLVEYRIIIPEYLLLYRHGCEADLYNVQRITTPMLLERASRHKEAHEHRWDLWRKRGSGEILSRNAIYHAQRKVEASGKQLYDLWHALYMCRIYPGLKWPSGYQEILDHLAK